MNFDLQQWLLILGPLLIAGVLVHGYFRMRAGQNEIRMKLDKNFVSAPGEAPETDELTMFKAELPNGGARVIRQSDPQEAVAKNAVAENAVAKNAVAENAVAKNAVANKAVHEQAVPVLMESVDVPGISAVDDRDSSINPAPGISALTDEPETVKEASVALEPKAQVQKAPPARPAGDAAVNEPKNPAETQIAEEKGAKETGPEDAPAPTAADSADQSASSPKPEKFVVINVLALDEPFSGERLQKILQAGGMAFGEMNIFHHLSEEGEPLFSLASAVEPGTFDLAAMDRFSTPGVTLFMRVHELTDPLRVLDQLLAVADAIAQELNGEVRDETRSVMTPQTIEYCRQNIREFQFKHSA